MTRSSGVEPEGPREWVPVEQVVGALAHLGPLDGAELRRELDEHFVTEVEDPFERWEVQRAERAGPAGGRDDPEESAPAP